MSGGKKPIKFSAIWNHFKTTPTYLLSRNAALFPLYYTKHIFKQRFGGLFNNKQYTKEEIENSKKGIKVEHYQSYSFVERFERKVFNTYWQDPQGKMIKIGTNRYANPEYLSELVSNKSNNGGLRYKGFIVNNYENVAFERSKYSLPAYGMCLITIVYWFYCWFVLDPVTDNSGLAYYTVRDLLVEKQGEEFVPNKKNIATLLSFKPEDIDPSKLAKFQLQNREMDSFSQALLNTRLKKYD